MQLGLPFEAIEFYFVRHRRARRYLLRVELDGRVRVTIPRGGSRREADAFARRHLEWISEQRQRIPEPALSMEQRYHLRMRARRELPPLLLQRAAELGLQVTRITIRNQRSRWGACARDGHITLNWRLIAMPDWVRNYVMIHELMHLKRMDHSPAYWRLVESVCPGYRQARHWLKVNGPALQ